MRNSLIFKLMGAFFLVIVIGALVITFLTSQATQKAFNLFSTRSGQVWALRLAPVLADFYAQSNGWQGMDSVLQSGLGELYAPGGTGSSAGEGHGYGAGRQSGTETMSITDQRLILADARGIVVSDTGNDLVGTQISADELSNGAPIMVNGDLVGTLIITPNALSSSDTPASEFIKSMNQAIITSAVIAGIIALIFGAVLFLQITAPLRKLRKAASAISRGDLNQRVKIHSRDELGDLGQAFNQMAENLSLVETQRQHLAADVAHELRTPLAAIQGTLEGIQDGVLPLDHEQVDALHAEAILLNRLVGDLRLLTLSEAGQLRLEIQQTRTGEFLQQVTERAKTQAQVKNVRLKTGIQKELPDLWIDTDRITQVLNNLISNAIRYTPNDGTITVKASYQASIGSVQVSVIDTGPGIEPENLPFVFDRFYRADKSRTRASGGSGLGLAIVKQLVEAHGGKVQAESPVFRRKDRLSCGTKISFTLPGLKP
jgi:signal transduction histidine kinase